MTDLSPEVKELLREARTAFSPPDGRLAAVQAALKAQMPAASSAMPFPSGPASGIGPRALGAVGWSGSQTLGTAVLIGALGAGSVAAWVAAARSNTASPEPTRVTTLVGPPSRGTSAESAPVSDTPLTSISTPESQALLDVPSVSKSAAASRDRARAAARPRSTPAVTSGDSLAEEVSMLRSARAALDRGDAAQALRQLDAHEAHFQHATLYEERLATRVLALCALGRVDAARSTAQELARAAPRSPHLSRVRASCVSQLPSK